MAVPRLYTGQSTPAASLDRRRRIDIVEEADILPRSEGLMPRPSLYSQTPSAREMPSQCRVIILRTLLDKMTLL